MPSYKPSYKDRYKEHCYKERNIRRTSIIPTLKKRIRNIEYEVENGKLLSRFAVTKVLKLAGYAANSIMMSTGCSKQYAETKVNDCIAEMLTRGYKLSEEMKRSEIDIGQSISTNARISLHHKEEGIRRTYERGYAMLGSKEKDSSTKITRTTKSVKNLPNIPRKHLCYSGYTQDVDDHSLARERHSLVHSICGINAWIVLPIINKRSKRGTFIRTTQHNIAPKCVECGRSIGREARTHLKKWHKTGKIQMLPKKAKMGRLSQVDIGEYYMVYLKAVEKDEPCVVEEGGAYTIPQDLNEDQVIKVRASWAGPLLEDAPNSGRGPINLLLTERKVRRIHKVDYFSVFEEL